MPVAAPSVDLKLVAPAMRRVRRRHVHDPARSSAQPDRTWIILVALTLLSVILRFANINAPTIWGDEAAVAWRTCGTYAQFIEVLKNDGFVPLHYTYYWVLKHLVTLTPFVLRLVPTLAAIAMVPAMYFLARQLVSTRVALLAAAFAAVSGHLGWHAADAKMYSHFWLMCTLCMGCFLWWLRTGYGLAFWCWVCTGVCMVGLQSQGWAIVALQPILFIFRGKPAGRSWGFFLASIGIFLVGLTIIAAGPATYYLNFNRWTSNIESRGWDASGIAWIKQYFTPDASVLVPQTTLHFLYGYDYPPPSYDGLVAPSAWVWAQEVPLWLCTLLAFALFPYPTRMRGRGISDLPVAWWRSALCLAMWVLLPAYAFYCASVEGYLWPSQIVRNAAGSVLAVGQWTALAIGLTMLAMYCTAATWRQRLWHWLGFAVICAVIFLLATAIAYALRNRPPGPVWVTRYMTFIWPGFVITMFALLERLPLPPLRWTVIGLLLITNLWASAARAIWRQSPPLDLFAADFIAAQEPNSTTQAHAIGMSPRETLSALEGRYYLFLYSGRPTYPVEFAGWGGGGQVFHLPEGTVTDNIEKAFLATPSTRRIIVWQQVGMSAGPRKAPPIPKDKLLTRLPAGWQCTSEKLYTYTSRWGWGALQGAWSRREFVEPQVDVAPATQPAQ